MGEAWLPLAQALQALGREADARVAFRAYRRFADFRREAAQLELRLRRSPDSPDLLLRMAALQERNERPDAALRYYRRALALRPDPEAAAQARRLESVLPKAERRTP